MRNQFSSEGMAESEAEASGEKTFLGGGKLASRSRHFVLIGVVAMIAVGGMNLLAGNRVSQAEAEVDTARQLVTIVEGVEKTYWQIRGDEQGFLLSGDQRHVEHYAKAAAELAGELDALFLRPDTSSVRDHVSTIIEGLTQHAGEFKGVVKALQTLSKSEPSTVAFALPKSVGDDAAKLSPENVARLKRLTASTEAMMEQEKRTARLNDIFAYIGPSLDSLLAFARERLITSLRHQVETRRLVALVLPASAIAIVLVLISLGMVFMGSITAPLRAIAGAATQMADGDDTVTLPAQANRDEMGDLARALAVFRANLGEAHRLREDLKLAKSEIEQGAVRLAEAHRAETVAAPPDAATTSGGPSGQAHSVRISVLSQQVAQSSQTVSIAALEAERTGVLIRGLGEAATRIAEVERLIGSIAGAVGDEASGNTCLAVDRARRVAQGAAANIEQVTRMAKELADASSNQALETTSELLQQSESLRGMLDDLVAGIRDVDGEPPRS